MGRRKILVLVAALVAAVGAGMVLLYVKSADNRADQKFAAQQVLVANAAITPGETIAAAKTAGKMVTKTVTAGSLVPGAIADLNAIPNEDIALTTIYPGEQILQSKFGESGSGSNTLGVPKDQIAISINLEDPARVAGFVNPGDHVVIFATADATDTGKGGTQVLLPDVTVVGVGSTTTVATTTTDPTGAQTTEQLPRTLMTLALDQADSQKIVYAQSGALKLTFGLRTKDSKVTKSLAPTGLNNLFN